MSFINCEINLIWTWSENCFIIDNFFDNQIQAFELNDAKHYVRVVTLSTQDNENKFKKLKPSLKEQLTGININENNNTETKKI